MSSIYIQEPPTSGKVLLHTTVGDIDIEIWSKETPKACRNFVQLCLEGYYDGTCFHRLVKGFIVQGGDPTGTGMGGESIYGKPFKDEFHTRLRFVRRGLVAMANAGKDDNGSQFFFTLDACPELQNKHTIFGKVTGNTLYNMLKLEDSLTDQNERPLYPHKIISSKVIVNPFPDIVPRVNKKSHKDKSEGDDKKNATKGTKNFSLLSFGEEAEEEEAETDAVVKGYRGKSKSSHDLTNDPKLSSVPAVESSMAKEIQGDVEEKNKGKKRSHKDSSSSESEMDEEEKRLEEEKKKIEREQTLSNIKKKLKKEDSKGSLKKNVESLSKADRYYQEKNETEEKKREEVRKEIQKLKKELSGKNKEPEKPKEDQQDGDEETEEEKNNNLLKKYHDEMKKYKELKKKIPKGTQREEQTLALLAKFTNKLITAKEKDTKDDEAKKEIVPSDEEDEGAWLTHHLSAEEQAVTIAKDANIKTAESYDLSDPRNPMNMRRREKGKPNSSSRSSGGGRRH